jgi:hypothetical protein
LNQRRSYPNSGDFNLDDLFRPEPGQQQGQAPDQQAGQQGQQPLQPGQQQPGQQQQGQQPVQQGQYPGQYSGAPEYLGAPPAQPQPQQQYAPQADPAPATQYLPPYPTADPGQAAPQAYGSVEPAYGPDQSYGQAVPGYPQQQQQQQPGYPPAGPGYAATAETAYTPAYTPAGGGGGGRRPSGRLIIGGVVAGCAAAGILVAVLMSGDDKQADPAKGSTPVAATSAPAASGTATADAMSPEAKEQAKALSGLLETANDSRQAVIGAVASVQKCDKLPESQQALSDAAGKRKDLQTKLAALKTDKLTGGPQLADQLNQAWQASATADEEYAAWAGDSQAGCDPKKLDNAHYKTAVQASGTATTAKKQAAGLWNAIAGQAGLPTKSDGDL